MEECYDDIVYFSSPSLFLSHTHTHTHTHTQDVQHHYEALLQMYGEKAEETEELRLDIQDLKSMYRQQVHN